jgi:formylglycine-generating enzyme required for sulfatase activity
VEQAKQRQADAAKALDVPVTMENSIGMKLNLIPAGRFLMGSPENEPGRNVSEKPWRQATVARAFFMGIHEVTQAHYQKVMEKNPSKFNKDNGGGPDHPVEQVPWEEAVAFCNKLSALPEEKQAGRVYRLPTESEWEYACRAGSQTPHYFGDDAQRLSDYAVTTEKTTRPVGQKKSNAWGLFDMLGNTWEICAGYDAPRGAVEVGRGGSFAAGPESAYSTSRSSIQIPANDQQGFRVVCEIRPPQVTNSIGMKLARIPAGSFFMGSPEDEPGRLPDEVRHEVVITRPFFMGVHELTIGQFRAFVKDTGYKTVAETNGKGAHRLGGAKVDWDPSCFWTSPGWPQTDEHPVVCVSRPDVEAFCRWLSNKEKKRYRLPTEAEWEYACRAGTTTAYHTGAGLNDKAANISVTFGKTATVGSYPANAFGLHDMHGNAAEWCADWYSGDYYRQSPRFDPAGPITASNGVLRSGSWAQSLRSAQRGNIPPDWSSNAFGARVVCEIGP